MPVSTRGTIVLVHGAAHGAWCFAHLAPLLEAKGFAVVARDLPGLGEDRTPLAGLRFEDWTESVAATLRDIGGRSILVGHSRGGAVISQVAERVPEHIDRLIYLTAYLLRDGESVQSMAVSDRESATMSYVDIDAAGGTCMIRDEGLVPLFYGQCSAEDLAFARARLRPEPLFGLATPVRVTAARFGSVPRYYVECTEDGAISLALQRRMQAALPCAGVVTLETDHSPFFSAPERLASALSRLSAGPSGHGADRPGHE